MVGKMKSAASEIQQILIQKHNFNVIEFTLKHAHPRCGGKDACRL